MFGKSQSETADNHRDSTSVQRTPRSVAASSAAPEASSISSGLSIVGKIVGHGALTIFGHVEGELRASTVVIAEGAQMEGEVSAEELTIGGSVKGTIHANRVKLNSTAVVESARFEGTSRRSENTIDTPSRVQTTRVQPQATSTDGNRKGNGALAGLSP
jgi:cytoskeletal protein CcmA (bactofilin family)